MTAFPKSILTILTLTIMTAGKLPQGQRTTFLPSTM